MRAVVGASFIGLAYRDKRLSDGSEAEESLCSDLCSLPGHRSIGNADAAVTPGIRLTSLDLIFLYAELRPAGDPHREGAELQMA